MNSSFRYLRASAILALLIGPALGWPAAAKGLAAGIKGEKTRSPLYQPLKATYCHDFRGAKTGFYTGVYDFNNLHIQSYPGGAFPGFAIRPYSDYDPGADHTPVLNLDSGPIGFSDARVSGGKALQAKITYMASIPATIELFLNHTVISRQGVPPTNPGSFGTQIALAPGAGAFDEIRVSGVVVKIKQICFGK